MERNGESCVQRAAAGDSAAFGSLVEEHTPWLLMRLTRRLGAQEAAEDVLQEAFIAAYQQLADLRAPDRFVPGCARLRTTKHACGSGAV